MKLDKYRITEVVKKDEGDVTYIWHPGVIPENIPVQQVYGFAITKENKICLVRDKGETRFTPPGGGVENGETGLEALYREFLEEAQFSPLNVKILGSLEVINPNADSDIQKHNLQVRFVCEVSNFVEFIPLKDGFETEERIFVNYKELPEYVNFVKKYSSGKRQFDMVIDFIEKKIEL